MGAERFCVIDGPKREDARQFRIPPRLARAPVAMTNHRIEGGACRRRHLAARQIEEKRAPGNQSICTPSAMRR
jgi:hypothetical protein